MDSDIPTQPRDTTTSSAQNKKLSRYFLLQEQVRKGPFTISQLRSMWNAGAITSETPYWQEGFDDWRPLAAIIDDLEPSAPTPQQASLNSSPAPANLPKSGAEETLWIGSPSHWNFFWQWFFVVLAVLACIAAYWFVGSLWILAIGVCLGIIVGLGIQIDKASRVYTVTNRKVIFQSGIFVKSTNEVRIKDIRSINVTKHGVAGLIGIGSVEFSSAATDRAEIVFANISGADRIRDMVRKVQDEG